MITETGHALQAIEPALLLEGGYVAYAGDGCIELVDLRSPRLTSDEAAEIKAAYRRWYANSVPSLNYLQEDR